MKSLFIPISLLLLLFSCVTKTDLSTPEKYAQSLINAVNNQDKKQFRELILNEADYEMVIKTMVKTEPQEAQRMVSEKAAAIQRLNDAAENAFTVINKDVKSISTFQLNNYTTDLVSDFEMIPEMELQIETPEHDKKRILITKLIKVNGLWKSTGDIRLDEVYAY